MVSPAEFIPVAEDIGLIASLGDWVLEQACGRRRMAKDIKVAVNLSPVQFRNRTLVQSVGSALRAPVSRRAAGTGDYGIGAAP